MTFVKSAGEASLSGRLLGLGDWSDDYRQKYMEFRDLVEEQLNAQYNQPYSMWELFWGISHPGGANPKIILQRLDNTFENVINSGGDLDLVQRFDAEMSGITTALQPVTSDYKFSVIKELEDALTRMAYDLGKIFGDAAKGAGAGTGLGAGGIIALALFGVITYRYITKAG